MTRAINAPAGIKSPNKNCFLPGTSVSHEKERKKKKKKEKKRKVKRRKKEKGFIGEDQSITDLYHSITRLLSWRLCVNKIIDKYSDD